MRADATNEKGRCAGIFHLIVRILTLPPIVIGITVLLMYVPANLLTLRELLLCELFLLLIPMAAYPIREIFHIGKDRRKGQRSTALVCSAIGYLCGFLWSILTPVLLARPHSIPLLCHFHRSTADSQRRFQAARKRPCLQHDGTCVSADVEAASAFYYTVRAADRSGLSILFEAVTPHPAAAPDWLGSQSACLWYFIADLRTRLTVMQPDN